MKQIYLLSILLITSIWAKGQVQDASEVLTPIPFNEVKLEDGFWLPRLEIQVKTLVPFALDKAIPAVENLEKTGKFLKGDTTDLPFPHRYLSSDLYKIMEGAAYLVKP